MSEPLVQVETHDCAVVFRLNRSERHNALVPDLLDALLDALNSDAVRHAPGVILAAKGRSFSTGGDLRGFWDNRDCIVDYASQLVGLLNEVILALYCHPAPVACAVQGQVTGGSLGLLLASDRVFMNDSATIRPWYASVGFSPDGGWTALLPSVIGERRALSWLIGDAEEPARACQAMGLAHELTGGDPVEAARGWARKSARLSTDSIRNTKRLVRQPASEIARRLEAERKAFVEQIQTAEAQAGLARFLGK